MADKGITIIAEAGVNHNGNINLAKKLIDTASGAGADMVKFQAFRAETLAAVQAPKADYQKETTNACETQFDMLKRLELDKDAHIALSGYAKEKNIRFLSSPFDLSAIDLLLDMGLSTWKIPSGEITNLPYLRKIGALGHKVIMSSGMADLGEIEDALDVLESSGTPRDKITVLHCNTEYPTPMKDVNLKAMRTIQSAFPGIHVGYSDHTEGIEVPIAAAAMGAKVIEKHFTLDKTLPGPDHKASLEPEELCAMVLAIRNIEKAMGSGIKKPSPSEEKNIGIARKSIVAKKSIQKGERFTPENLAVKRPGTGISPMRWDEVLARTADRDYEKDEPIHA